MQAEHNQETQHDQSTQWTPTLKSRIVDCLQAEKLIAQIQSGQIICVRSSRGQNLKVFIGRSL